MTAKKFNNLELKKSIREKLNEHADLINENKEAIENISGGSLDDLLDVIITTPTSGQALTYNGTDWINSTPVGGGDMLKSVYDTNDNGIVDNSEALNGQAGSHYLARANHTGTQLASTISDFQTTVSSNTDVSANTTARHTHANKALLDTYTNTNADISDAISKEHTHANKAILDATTASYTTGEASKLAGIEAGAEVNTLNDVIAGTNITIDKTDPLNPIITSTASGTGDVTGPASSVTGSIATYNGTTGKIIQDGGATIAQVQDRSTHTGTQTMSTISDAGALATLNTVDTAQINNDAVTFDKIENISKGHFLARSTAGSGSVEALSTTQARAELGLADVAISGSYNDLSNTPTIPTLTSELTNDSGFITSAPVSSVNGRTGAVTGLAEASDIPDNTDFVDLTTAQTVGGQKTFSMLTDNDLGTTGGTVAIDWANGLNQKITLNANTTFTFANPRQGHVHEILLTQDSTARTVTFPTITWANGTAPDLSVVSGKYLIQLTYRGTTYFGASISFNA